MSHHVELRDLSPRQRKALEDYVTSLEDADPEVELSQELEEPAETEEELRRSRRSSRNGVRICPRPRRTSMSCGPTYFKRFGRSTASATW
jgi:hypothetical protein